jgi:hypothetical protein
MQIRWIIVTRLLTWLLFFCIVASAFSYHDVLLFAPRGLDETSFNDAIHTSIVRGLLVGLGCVIGILGKSIYDDLPSMDSQMSYRQLFSRALAPKRVVTAAIACPLTILAFQGDLGRVTDPMLLAVLAFQNGFFFQTILKPPKGAANAHTAE